MEKNFLNFKKNNRKPEDEFYWGHFSGEEFFPGGELWENLLLLKFKNIMKNFQHLSKWNLKHIYEFILYA